MLVCRVQGFEPRKSTIGMPRPKKARPPQVGTERSGISSAVAAASSKEEASPSGPMELELGTAESSDKAVDQELLKDAAKLTKTARCSVREATVVVRKAEAALRQEQRRAEERMKRWDAAERRPEPPPAYLQLERVYKSQVKELKARLKLSEAQRAAAEAKAELSDALKLKAEYLLACSAV